MSSNASLEYEILICHDRQGDGEMTGVRAATRLSADHWAQAHVHVSSTLMDGFPVRPAAATPRS